MAAQSMKARQLLQMAKRGPFTPSDVSRAGIPRSYVARLVATGMLQRVGRGLYRASDAAGLTELATVAEVAKRVPSAIVCLLTALQMHGMTTELPSEVWIMIDRKARVPKMESPSLAIVRA